MNNRKTDHDKEEGEHPDGVGRTDRRERLGFISEDEREDAIKSWKADTFYDDFVSGAFCIDLDKLADVEKVEQDA